MVLGKLDETPKLLLLIPRASVSNLGLLQRAVFLHLAAKAIRNRKPLAFSDPRNEGASCTKTETSTS